MEITFSRLFIGVILICIGIILLILSFLAIISFIIPAIIILILGIFILLNEKEDKIENRKDIKVKKSKK